MTWFEALNLAIRLIQTITPIIGTVTHSGASPLDPAALDPTDVAALAALHAHVQGPGQP